MCNDSILSNSILKSCRLEVDTEYSEELDNLHNDYPLVSKKIEIKESMPSDFCRDIANKYNISVVEVKNILQNLGNKNNMECFYSNNLCR